MTGRPVITFYCLCKRILSGVHHALRLVEVDILYRNADILEYFIQSLAVVAECNCTVVRVVLFNENVSVETSHLRNCEYTYAAEGLGSNGKNFTVSDVCTQLAVSGGL